MSAAAFPEFRTDVLTGLRVLVAPVRSSRPSALHPEPPLSGSDDPFEEGNEQETPGERFVIRIPDTPPNSPGWKLRIVPNRYPAVAAEGPPQKPFSFGETDSCFPSQNATGEHDVVIECPDSRSRLIEFSTVEIAQVFLAWQARLRQLAQDGRYGNVSVFRNEGFSAGASLAHCHSQIIASEQTTPLETERSERASRHYETTGSEITLDLLNAELRFGKRVVLEAEHFVVLCPFASRTSWHVRFVPRSSKACSFVDAEPYALTELAELVKQMLTALERALGGPFSFNLILPHPHLNQPPRFRWMLELLPRTGRSAGWEFLTAVDIVTVAPEQAASLLRQQISQRQA